MLLIGFDMQGSHFFGEHPKGLDVTSPWQTMLLGFYPMISDLMRAGVSVVNCSPSSAIQYIPRCRLKDALAASELNS